MKLLIGALLFGAGLWLGSVFVTPSNELADDVTLDPYAGWQTIIPGGVVSLRIPPDCVIEGAAGSTYVQCVTINASDPINVLVASSDGMTVNIRRWEGLEWEHWEEVIASLKVVQPVQPDEGITIYIEK